VLDDPRMTWPALVLVLAAAVCHAVWNLLLKRAGEGLGGNLVFVWLFLCCSTALWAPVAAIDAVIERPHVGWPQLGFMAGSGVLHLVYFLLLQRGYAAGDLSVVYPLARGTGPILAMAGAMVILGERPGGVAIAGGVVVALGILGLSGGRATPRAVAYALATGGFIAVYTIWDKHGVDALAVPPVLYFWAGDLLRSLLLAPSGLRRRREARAVLAAHPRAVLGVAVLAPLAYVLVLGALVFTPASYVAPAREVSIALAVVLGAFVLHEEQPRRRLACAVVIVAGVVALAIG
jgi:drug/metabolite transporter (DMT)-like permease